MIWNKNKECMSRDEMHALQSKRLQKLVARSIIMSRSIVIRCRRWICLPMISVALMIS